MFPIICETLLNVTVRLLVSCSLIIRAPLSCGAVNSLILAALSQWSKMSIDFMGHIDRSIREAGKKMDEYHPEVLKR